MLDKILNPFGIKVTQASTAWTILGAISSMVLHGAFYFAIFHFVRKFW